MSAIDRIPFRNPNPVFQVTAEGEVLFANPAARGFIAKMGTQDYLPETWIDLLQTAYNTDTEVKFEYEIDQSVIAISLVPIAGSGCLNVYGIDISQQLSVERALRESEIRYRAIVEDQEELICRYLPIDGTLTFVNNAYCRYFDQSYEQLVGKSFLSRLHDDDLEDAISYIQSLTQESPIGQHEHRTIMEDGDIRWQQWTDRAIIDEFGMVIEVQGVGRDITEQKDFAIELSNARDQALAVSRLKSEFLATISHETRTPINAIMGMTELLLMTSLTPEQREFSETVLESAKGLLSVINSILELTKFEADRVILDNIEFNLESIVRKVIEVLTPEGKQKSLALSFTIKPNVPTSLQGDPWRLRQILMNLIHNAVKFTESGQIHLSVTRETISDDDVVLRFAVNDTGIGLDETSQQRLFQPFMQVDSSITRRYGGTGLGLAIVKRLVELMHGEVGVESEAGQGSTFWFTASFDLPQSQQSSYPPDPSKHFSR